MNWEKKGYHVNHKSLFVYNSKMKDYFSEYKFHGDYQLCKVFAEELRQTVRKEYSDYLVIPVPLSLERQKERGFNQVIGIIEAGNLDYSDLILKQDVESQSKRNKKERENSVNPFVLKKGIVLPDKVLIVDDIYTTGTTIFQIQDICKVKGAKKIKRLNSQSKFHL
ncbi:ComF family protein [Streptococcus iniae]|uniref:ComF family protein n=1 Tax=Streptococcus iniae TaxID=1346 RepID=UPI000EF80C19|nr:ComF family protein [Streptococcus iniae]RLV11342.1 ComF family protein [Streptococcus iniae]